jgi:biopolymer transport protein TolR
MAGGTSNDSKGIYEPNMTPLIDVCLVLVVILMVATPMALQSSIALSRQAANQAPVPAPPPERRLNIEVEAEDRILVNGEPVAREALRSTLAPHIGPDTPVIVHCAADVTHGTFVYVLDEAKQGGAQSIAVVGR